MSITSITLGQRTFDEMGIGLAKLPLDPPLEMRSIGKTVVLAGANGSGKTRLLELVKALVGKQLTAAATDAAEREIRQAEGGLAEWSNVLRAETNRGSDDVKPSDRFREAEQQISAFKDRIAMHERQLISARVMTRSSDSIPQVIEFVPQRARLADPRNENDRNLAVRATRFRESPGSAEAEHNAPAYARHILRAALWAWNRRSPGAGVESGEEKAARELKAIVASLLGPQHTLDLSADWNLSIGGYENYFDVLSPGQQVVFQFACLLHAQGVSLSSCLVMIDEPENHLHPAALAQVVDSLSECLASGQLWIATHSVPLIAQLTAADPDCLWYLEDGRVQRAGRAPERVLDGLMGGSEGWKHLSEFTLLPAQYAGLRFLSDCLKPPAVALATPSDPQTNQIARLLRDRSAPGFETHRRLRVLDFGAGRGRLLAALRADSAPAEEWLDYFAYDSNTEHAEDVEREVAAVYACATGERVFGDLHTLTARVGTGTVDVVVMCGVLHEINPDRWIPALSRDGAIYQLLSPEGYLLIMEDYGIPVGERAHPYGFLLLDEPELCKLFAITPADREARLFVSNASPEPRYRHRLKVHLVGRECVARITSELQRAAIASLRDRMADAVDETLRSGSLEGARAGRNYALSTQLLANATIWLRAKGHA